MKRFFCLLFVLLFLAGSSFAESYWIFNACGSTEGVENLFNGEAFSLTLYFLPSSLKAYIIETTFINGKPSTISLSADIKSKTTDHFLYFLLENGNIIKGHYDQNGYDFWIDFDSGSIKLHMVDEFNPYFDFIGGKYAQEAP